MNREASLEHVPGLRLLGGWRDILDDLGRLQQRVSSVDGRCRCGHVADAEPARPCCAVAARDLATACAACSRDIADVAVNVERIEEDTIRFLPAVLDMFAAVPQRYAAAVVVEHSFIRLLVTFRRLQSTAGEWAQGCQTTHLLTVKERAEEVAVACRHFDAALNRLT